MPPNTSMLRQFQNRIQTLRRDSRTTASTSLAGYIVQDGTVGFVGDDNAPYGQHPPFPTEFSEYGFVNPTTTTHVPEDSVFPLYPVEFYRTFTLCVDYTPGTVDNNISIVVYNVLPSNAPNYTDALFFPISYIEPVTVPGPIPGFTQNFEQRFVGPQALFSREAIDLTPIRFTVSFDVSPYSVIGVTVAESVVEEGEPGSVRLFANASL